MIIKFGKELVKKYLNLISNYWLSKFTKFPARHYIRPGNRADLTKFMKDCMDSVILQIKANQLRAISPEDDDRLMIDILRFVYHELTYKSDLKVWKVPEYWQTAEETYKSKIDDCEGGAVLIVTLARLAGIASNRVFLNGGWLRYNRRDIGHAYVTYQSNNAIMYHLDWSNFVDLRRIQSRIMYVLDTRYIKPVWWFGSDGGFYI